jgi:hypothetical protein
MRWLLPLSLLLLSAPLLLPLASTPLLPATPWSWARWHSSVASRRIVSSSDDS